jgi:hypothetical protein
MPSRLVGPVVRGEGPVAVALSGVLADADPKTADAVAAVVRLALTDQRLRTERQAQLEELRAARR